MARDYVKNGLRSGEQVTIKTDRISEEGAYVCIPVETLDKVAGLLEDALDVTDFPYTCGKLICEIKKELFPEEESR